MLTGVLDLPWWGIVLWMLALTHITIICVTVFLHRCQAHHALDLHPVASHFFRFWLWLTTGMVTKEWAAIHRKHHAKCETAEDPHSPQIVGIRKVLLPARNRKDLEDVPKSVRDDVEFVFCERVDDAIRESLGIEIGVAAAA